MDSSSTLLTSTQLTDYQLVTFKNRVTMTPNIQEGLNNLALAGVIILTLTFSFWIMYGAVQLLKFTITKISINLKLKRDKLQSLGLRK